MAKIKTERLGMTNFKKYKHKESGDEVEAYLIFDIKGQPFLLEKRTPNYRETSMSQKDILEFLEQYEPIK